MSNVFARLIGLETEYAIRFQPDHPSQPLLSKFQLYEALRGALQRAVLTVPAKHFKEGVFTANGGAVWFEAERPSAGGGLVEGATPECRCPRELLIYQRAQDRLVADCAAKSGLAGTFRLIKNDRDAADNIYGAQENYDAVLAEGTWLLAWRVGLVLLFPLAMLTWGGILLSVIATLTYFALAGLIYMPLRWALGERRSLGLFLFGRDLMEGRETCVHVPVWLETTLQLLTRVITAPLAGALYVLLRGLAFRKQRQHLEALLMSRAIVSGAGMVDARGQFQLSDKAPAINCLLGFGGMFFDRPVFSMGHFFKEIYAESWFAPRNYFRLFGDRNRLQIALGDSNMCETAEFLRFGTTLLVLDAIEAGFIRKTPRLRHPIRALHQICTDPSLSLPVQLVGGATATALELQRFYLEQCRLFLNERPEAPAAAWGVVRLWEQVLVGLENQSDCAASEESLVGKVDWLTKQYFLDHAAADAGWAERKKIDIRYHELSSEGYYSLLEDSGLTSPLVTDDEVERAVRSAPANTPATTRGHYIREFSEGDAPVSANWKVVVLGSAWDARVIWIADYGRPGETRVLNSLRKLHNKVRNR